MVEMSPETGLAGAGIALLWKVLGPAAGELGEALRRWTEYRTRNVGRIVQRAAAKSNDLDRPGAVHPRVAYRVLEEGSLVDDEVMQEYLAGLLVAGRTEDQSDDDAVYFLGLLTSLASNQVRLHHAIYSTLRGVGFEGGRQLDNTEGRARCNVYIPFTDLVDGYRLAEPQVLSALEALHRERLIGDEWGSGLARHLRVPEAERDGLHVAPTAIGARLFLWGHGRRTARPSLLLDPGLHLPDLDPPLPPPPGGRVAVYGA